MIKLSIKHVSGVEIAYEGPEEGLERVLSLLSGEFIGALQELGTGIAKPDAAPPSTASPSPVADSSAKDEDVPATALDARAIAEQFEKVGAKTDIERLAVIAQAAVEAGHDGLGYETVDRVFLEMGLKRPPKWRPTFSNARTRGYLRNVGRGLWLPTVIGQNFALLGERAPARKRATRSSNGGGDD